MSSVSGVSRGTLVPDPSWDRLLAPWGEPDVVAVAPAPRGGVFAFARTTLPVMEFSAGGSLLAAWGEGLFVQPHGIRLAGDVLWCVDVTGNAVRRFTTTGNQLEPLGPTGVRGAAGDPYGLPTDVCVLADGTAFVADGYGNSHVHRFDPYGAHEYSWGGEGAGRDELLVPHAIVATPDEQHLLVADRENDRIVVVDLHGVVAEMWEGLARPSGVTVTPTGEIWVSELGDAAGRLPCTRPAPDPPRPSGCVQLTPDGRVHDRIADGDPTRFQAAHAIVAGPAGELYVSDVGRSAGVPADRGTCRGGHAFQRFVRSRSHAEETP